MSENKKEKKYEQPPKMSSKDDDAMRKAWDQIAKEDAAKKKNKK